MQAVMITAIIVFGLVGGFVSLCYWGSNGSTMWPP